VLLLAGYLLQSDIAFSTPLDSTSKYVPGVIRIRLSKLAVDSSSFQIKGSIIRTGNTGLDSVDQVLYSYGMREVSAQLFKPVDEKLSEEFGLNRVFTIAVDSIADIESLAVDLAALGGIEYAVPDWYGKFASTPNDPMFNSNWGHRNTGQLNGTLGFDCNTDLAWDKAQGHGDSSIIIAILDSGVDTLHPDLRLVRGYNYGDNNPYVMDLFRHGTCAAGIAAAIANNSIGAVGVAGGCSIMPMKVSSGASGSPISSAVVNAIIHAADSGARVISMSISLPADSILESAINYAYSKGVVLLGATGNVGINDGSVPDAVLYPAKYPNVLAIGAAAPCGYRKRGSRWDEPVSCDGQIWSSRYGPEIDFLAPTILPTTDILGSVGFSAGDYWALFDGTSCACPYAAGVVALMLSADPTLTPSQVKQRLINGAHDIVGGYDNASVGFDNFTGYGLIDARNSVPTPDTVYVTYGGSPQYSTIQAAIDALPHGSLILVQPGTYSGSLNFKGKRIQIMSVGGPLVTTLTGAVTDTLVKFKGGENSATVLDGFRLKGGRIGILCQNASPTIRRCILDGQQTNDAAAITLGGTGYASTGNSPATIINCTVVNSSNGGIVSYSTVAPTIKNSLVLNNMTYGIARSALPEVAQPQLSYNDVYGNVSSNYLHISNAGTGSISANPLTYPDLSLRVGSPCINTGNPDPAYNDPNGSRNDMGCLPHSAPVTANVPSQYASIQSAIDAVPHGSTVNVASGIYINSLINFKGKFITVKSVNGPRQTTITNSTAVNLVTFNSGETSESVLEGFRLLKGSIGVLCENASPSLIRLILDSQLVTAEGAITLRGTGAGTVGHSPALILKNTIKNAAGVGILTYSSSAPVIKNTIVFQSAQFGIRRANDVSVAQPNLSYNDVYNNSTNYDQITGPGTGSISADPLFVQSSYTILGNSPCNNTGDPDPAYNEWDGSRSDIGAVPFVVIEVVDKLVHGETLPDDFALAQNYPNPFNPTTIIELSLPVNTTWDLTIFNILGQQVDRFDGTANAGILRVEWDGSRHSSGVYFYSAQAGAFRQARKMLLIK